MQIKTVRKGDALMFLFDGELDEHASHYVRQLMDREISDFRFREVVLDFKDLSFMDSTGIGVILGRYKKLNALNVPIFVMNTSKQIDKILTTSGLYRIIKKIS